VLALSFALRDPQSAFIPDAVLQQIEKIGRYQVVGELGRGAMGVVYRAIDPNIGRTVALKTMRLDIEGIEHDEMLQRFRNEARAAGLMSHPNIVTIHDADECGGLFYIAMEYLEGETLQSLMSRKRVFSAEEIVALARQVAAGLDYAHTMNVVHRDIKPANIMITRQNVAKIMDFGISKSVGTMTRTGQVLGTPYYMSPEQVMGRQLDGRADLFSFGVVLYEMATGERPFTGENVTTIIYKIVNEAPVPACELQISVHPGLSAAITRCLAKKPEDRYQTGAQLAGELENFRSLQPADDQVTVVLPAQAAARQKTSANASSTIASATALKTVPLQSAAAVAARTAMKPAEAPKPAVPKKTMAVPHKGSLAKKLAWIAAAMFVVLLLGTLNKAKQRKEAAQNRSTVAAHDLARNRTHETPARVPNRNTDVRVPQPSEGQNDSTPAAAQVSTQAVPEKTQVPVTPKRASIRFTTNPEGAVIRFDGHSNPAWATPFTMADIVPGTHHLVLTKDGYSTETRDLEIGPKNSTYNVDLVPETTAIAVSSDPPGASIEIDGSDTGKVTPAQIPVSEGQHTVVLRLDGYRQMQARAQVEKGQMYNLPEKLAPLMQQPAEASSALRPAIPAGKGMVDFVTYPPGASIFVEGHQAKAVTPAHSPFPPGNYSIELRLPGYKPLQRMVHVEEGQVSSIKEYLDPQ